MTVWRRVTCWISKDTRAQAHARTRAPTATHTHTNIKYLFLLHGSSGFVNAPQCYVKHTFSVLLSVKLGGTQPNR